jgi:hypothetical protein
MMWNTFMGGGTGSAISDLEEAIATDASGNIYVVGSSGAAWGSPVTAYHGGTDTFVAKLNSTGVLQWMTFLGGSSTDSGNDIVVDGSGNVYVAGFSNASWGTPIASFSGGYDAFVAKLDNSGALQWNTFLGGTSWDAGLGIALGSNASIFVTGFSNGSWGSYPKNPFGTSPNAFLAKLNSSGVFQWHTFFDGSAGGFNKREIVVDGGGNIIVAGECGANWGNPVNPHSGAGYYDFLVIKFNSIGDRLWHTFLGASGSSESPGSIALDSIGNIYVTGRAPIGWGNPVNPHSGGDYDAVAAKFDANGLCLWHTFVGGSGQDQGRGISVDANGDVFVAGFSNATWGDPLNSFSGGSDGFIAKLNSEGFRQYNTFFGSSNSEDVKGIALDGCGNSIVVGKSHATWGNPVHSYSGNTYGDAFVAKFGLGTECIAITSPNGGENWITGENHVITWCSSGTTTQVNIDYSTNNGGNWTSLASQVANSGTYSWTIPDTPSANSRVRVSNSAIASLSDQSNAVFTISPYVPPSISVTSPNGGEDWASYDTHEITWTSAGAVDYVRIEYSIDNGSNWNTEISSVANSGSYSWNISVSPSTECLVRVSDAANPAVFDVSDANFTISDIKTLSVTSPNGGENWTAGSIHNITWNYSGSIANVNIDYSTDYASTWSSVATNVANSKSYSWTVPATPSTACNSDINDIRDSSFSIIVMPTITVLSPNGGEQWQRGTTQVITWTSSGVTNVKIELLKGTAVNLTITSSTPAASGSFNWAIPASQAVATNYKIRITSTASSSVTDSSNATFSIFAPAITVTAPAAGNSWAKNTVKTITWSLIGTMNASVKIQLYSGTTKKLDITLSTENDGSYDWLIPSSLANGTYTLRITTVDGLVVGNSGSFSIVNGIITVTAPATGASWQRGVLHTITWTGEGTLNANVKIQLLKGTAVNLTIATTTPNDGSFDWTIPASQALATNYKIRIITVDSLVIGNSGVFSITNTAGLTLQAPNGNEHLAASSTFPIRWTIDKSVNEVKLEYSRDNGSTFFTIADNVPNSGQYEWLVPVNFTFNGIIRVSDSQGKNWLDQDGLLECLVNFNCNSRDEARQPDFAVWFGSANVKAPGYGFARVAIGRETVRMAEASRAIEPLSGGWHEAKIRLDLKRDLGTLFIDGKPIMENVALYTSKSHHFEPYLSLRAGGSTEVDLLLGELKFQVVLLGANGNELERFTVLNEDFSGYDAERNVIGSCWQVSGLKPDKPALRLKSLPGMGQALQLRTAAGMPITICKPLAIPEKIPFDISDRSFIIEMLPEVD